MRFVKVSMLSDLIQKERPVAGKFFITQLDDGGNIVSEHVTAKRLIYRSGKLYLYGWCQMVPAYRRLDVERIAELADDGTGEIVPRADVAAWLARRSYR